MKYDFIGMVECDDIGNMTNYVDGQWTHQSGRTHLNEFVKFNKVRK